MFLCRSKCLSRIRGYSFLCRSKCLSGIRHWDSLQIERRWEEEGPHEIHIEEGMYEKLGLKENDKKKIEKQERKVVEEETQVQCLMNVLMSLEVGIKFLMRWLHYPTG
jgi:hypothetical protein